MIASLVDKGSYYVCSNCMMKQKCDECTCWFCGRIFDNFEEVAIKEFKTSLNEFMEKNENE